MRTSFRPLRVPHASSMRCGLTLIELVTALALAAVLMVLTLGIVASLSQANESLREAHPNENWKKLLAHQLQSDYSSCRSVLLNERALVIRGYDSNQNRGESTFGPTQISYRVVTQYEQPVLVREVVHLGDSTDRRRTTEVVCTGALAFYTDSDLATDVAPGVFHLKILLEGLNSESINFNLVRHGGKSGS